MLLSPGDIVWGDIGSNVALATKPSTITKELGAYAEYAVALDTQLALAPIDAISLFEICSLPKVALTSYKALVWYAGAPWDSTAPGAPRAPNVLILGGSGGKCFVVRLCPIKICTPGTILCQVRVRLLFNLPRHLAQRRSP